METFFASLIAGLMSLIAQRQFNNQDMDKQNQYNEEMYNRYNSPSARAQQLRAAGMSDAGIGSALSGYNGSGTVIQSAPIQGTDVAGIFNNMLSGLNETKKVSSEVKLNELSGEEIKENCRLLNQQFNVRKYDETIKFTEWQKLINELSITEDKAQIAQIELKIARSIAENTIKLSNAEVKKASLVLEKMRVDLEKGKYEKDMSKFYSYYERYKNTWLKITGMPYDDFKISKNPFQLIEIILKTLGGKAMQFFGEVEDVDYSGDEVPEIE